MDWLLPPRDRPARAFYWLLLATICGLGLFLLVGQKPWDAKLLRSIERRVAAGKSWKVEHYVAVFEWGAAAVNLLLAAGLIGTLRWWARPLADAGSQPVNLPSPKWLAIGLGLAVLLGAHYRLQRLSHSFWSDEEYSVRSHIWGEMVEAADGSLRRQPVPWRDTFFRNKVNNHLGFTIPARLVHEAWAGFGATAERPFSEAAMRALPLLASLASIVLIGHLVARHASPVAGLGAAFLLALNPWYLRYSVEARGYAGLIFFLLLASVFLIRAIQHGRWRDWLWFGAAELGALLNYGGAIYVLLIANAAAFGLIFFKRELPLRGRATLAGRMLVANLIAAMIFLQLIAPSVGQVLEYLRSSPLVGHMSLAWWRGVWSLFTSGLPWSDPSPGQHVGSSLSTEAARIPGLRAFLVAGLLALLLLGIAGAVLRRSWLLLPGLAVIAGGALAFIQNNLGGNLMHPWYVVFMLIGFVVFIALGVETAAVGALCLLPRKDGSARPASLTTAVVSLAMVLFLALYATATVTGRRLLCQHSRHPIREVVRAVRGNAAYSPQDGNLITASFGTSKGMITSYDPRNRTLDEPADLNALIAEASTSGKRLVIYHCGLERARVAQPEMVATIENPAIFEEQLPAVLGLEELFSYHVYRYVGP